MAARLSWVFALAIVGVALAAGAFAVGQHRRIGTGPNWAEIVTAIATAAVAGTVVVAIRQLQSSERDRHVQIIAELTRRWNSVEMEQSRVEMLNHQPNVLAAKIQQFLTTAGGDPQFEILVRVPQFFEDVAVLIELGAIPPRWVRRAFGNGPAGTWMWWEPAIRLLQAQDRFAFTRFEQLAARLPVI